MKKKVITILMLGLLILSGTQLAYATEVAVAGTQRSCFLDLLPEGVRAEAERIISEFHTKVTALRERLFAAREAGDLAERNIVRNEIWQLNEEKRTAILDLLPPDLQDLYLERGLQKKQSFRPEIRPERHGRKNSHSLQQQVNLSSL